VVALEVGEGSFVQAGDTVVVLEVMKMEHPVTADAPGAVEKVHVRVGDSVEAGNALIEFSTADFAEVASPTPKASEPALLREVEDRHLLGRDEARPDAVESRRARGKLTAREYVGTLCHDFIEYGPLAVAAQRGRRGLDDLIRRTPADGMIGGIGRIDTGTRGDDRAVVVSYDYTVLAGTQGFHNHRKKDRLFALAADMGLPVVLFAEGGGGRPGDVDWPGVSMLEVPAFRLFAEIPTPRIGINTGYCFAGNAALLGQCDVIVATRDSNVGMGGPAMIEGGGLGSFAPDEIGPVSDQTVNGVVDIMVEDDQAAVEAARALVGLVRGATSPGEVADQGGLRACVPDNRRRVYDMRQIISTLVDGGTFVELRSGCALAAITGFARVEGRPLGIIANDPHHLAGAIDHTAAVSIARHLRLCDSWGLPVLSLCDTPGFMVGPEAEAEGLVRSAGDLFRASAEIGVPLGTVVTRRGYGLGAMAMAGGGFGEGRFIVGWPTSEFGPMGLEGAVKLGYKRELEAIDDAGEREREVERRVEEMLAVGRGINVASHFEIDDVIDPADTRRWIATCL